MSRVAVVTDSNSGITQEMAKELGMFVLSMPFTIDNKEYFEGVDLNYDEFYEKLEGNSEIFTSQPSPASIMGLWDSILEEYDELVYIPMSSGLSSTCQTAIMLSEDYNGKVQVINNQRISVTQSCSCLDALKLAKMGKSAAEIKNILEEDKLNASIYIMLDTLSYLKKGGRITAAAAALGTLLRLKPVLQIQGDKLDAFAKARTSSQGKTIMINAIKNDIENRFGGIEKKNVKLYVVHTKNIDGAKEFKAEVQAAIPEINVESASELPMSIACHIGPGTIAIAAVQNLSIS